VSDSGAAADPKVAPRDAFQNVCDRFLDGVTIAEPHQATKWIIRTNLADAYRSQNIFLCGDATHIHSPSGGQGMNACMQDAFNLGWKLATVERGEGPPSLLDSYERERRPIAEQVTAGAHAMHQIQMAHGTSVEERLALTRRQGWHDEAIARIAGLSHNYRAVAAQAHDPLGGEDPTAGDRAPDAVIARAPECRLFDVFRHPRVTLMMVPGKNSAQDLNACAELIDLVAKRYSSTIKPMILASADAAQPSRHPELTYFDETGEGRECYAPSGVGRLYIIRPDAFIGFRGALAEHERLRKWLNDWLNAAG
jgi:hypothetical protein